MAAEAPRSGPAAGPSIDALLAEATRRAGVVWVTVPGADRARPIWTVWADGSAYLVTGGREQPLPGIDTASRVEVTVPSKDTGARLLTWVAEVSRLPAGGEEWTSVLPLLAQQRLNPPDGEDSRQRWARESTVVRLTPTGELTDAADWPARPDRNRAGDGRRRR